MSDDSPIRLRGVTKSFGAGSSEVFALRGINLDISVGELFMLVGPSGCGKTTLISIVAGILKHDKGEAVLLWLVTPPIFLLNSIAALLSRRMTWRGTTYELKSASETVIIRG